MMKVSEKLFSDLYQAIPQELILVKPLEDAHISGVTLDSRHVRPRGLFVAISGGSVDGHRFISDALQRGAAAIVGTKAIYGLKAPYLQVSDSRLALAHLSAAFYDFPARQLTVIGVTGTDGKTTTANLIYQILLAADLKTGMVTTVNALIGERALDTGFHVTTPEAPDVQRYLAQMAAGGLTHVILEATSHGLAQERVAACEFDMAVVTNITHEHLDYHGSYEAYRAAKGRLFSGLSGTTPKPIKPQRGAVLNYDDISYDYLSQITGVDWLSYGLDPGAHISARNIIARPDGLGFEAVGRDLFGDIFEIPLRCNLVGAYNVANCLGAVTLTRGLMRLPDEAVQRGMVALEGIPGRMQSINMGQDFDLMVDFAHTPNALKRTLESGRELTDGRLIAVFGSAGLRDRQKRRLMADISAELADLTVLTAEDPRTESLDDILAEMAAGAESRGGIEGRSFWRVPDRGEAIRFALRLARPDDLVIICGKGHEQSMCFGTVEYAWDDRTAARAALADYLGVDGPDMPHLPTSPF
jgi:UDP-N-acetylmuramoyl-L-alanyl-D-glutamate--2,6-diaminopimelate ligase